MTSLDRSISVLDSLKLARQIANYAQSLGVKEMTDGLREQYAI
jgi:hypothetical protein